MNTLAAFALGFVSAIGLGWVLGMCRSAGVADMCSECIRRREEKKLEEQAMRAASHVILPPSQVITPPDCGVLQGGSESSQQAGTISEGRFKGAILEITK